MASIRVGHIRFPRSRQRNTFACGARCVYAILKNYEFQKKYKLLESELGTTPEDGTAVEPMVAALRARTLTTTVSTQTTLRALTEHLNRGIAILHVDGDHFMVVHARRGKHVYVMDPMGPPNKITTRTLHKRWDGWAILVRP
jgi:ABC-type bacteriocin/lantibiotic exporter with double-glycine peptidase domain